MSMTGVELAMALRRTYERSVAEMDRRVVEAGDTQLLDNSETSYINGFGLAVEVAEQKVGLKWDPVRKVHLTANGYL